MNTNKFSIITFNIFVILIFVSFARVGTAQPTTSVSEETKFSFNIAASINVTNVEELYAAVNNTANVNNQIILAAGVYTLSVNDPGGAARPNGGRLELQDNMSLRGVAGNRQAVVIDAANLPASSYTAPATNTGAIRMGKGTNAVEWLTIRNAVNGGAGIIAHLSAPGTAYVRIAHCVSTGNARGIDIRNIGASAAGNIIEAEIVDNDLNRNRISTAQGLRIINTGGSNTSVINAYLAGNRMFDNSQGLIAENIGSTNGGVVTVYSSGDHFYDNGGGATIGAALGPSNNNTLNFVAVGSVFENNNGSTDFYRGGLNVAASISFQTANGGSNNTTNVTLRNCRLANNQVADLNVFGTSSIPSTVGPSGSNNRAKVRLIATPVTRQIAADSNPVNPAAGNTADVIRSAVTPNFDFDGSDTADLSVFRPSDQIWYINRASGGYNATPFGLATDKLVSADYDGDGKTDIAIFRDGWWWWINSSTGIVNVFQFGQAGDIPHPADFDGDGRSELVVAHDGSWYVNNLAIGRVSVRKIDCGLADICRLVENDYDGDGKADYATYRIYAGNKSEWYVETSSGSYISSSLGANNDIPVPADYDGDGKTDLAVFRPSAGAWIIHRSTDGNEQIVNWGISTDKPVPADYDGDGKADVAIFRGGVWWINQSRSGLVTSQFGLAGDIPLAGLRQ